MKILVNLSFLLIVSCSAQIQQPPVLPETIKQIDQNNAEKNISNTPVIRNKDIVIGRPSNFSNCGLTAKARELAELIAKDADQKRPLIECNIDLARIADAKAKEMAEMGEVSHKGQFEGPNARLINHGIRLSHDESLYYNTVESILGGEEHSDDVWTSFKSSYPHNAHLLAGITYFEEQSSLGVGYFRKKQSPHIYYWVVYFAKTTGK